MEIDKTLNEYVFVIGIDPGTVNPALSVVNVETLSTVEFHKTNFKEMGGKDRHTYCRVMCKYYLQKITELRKKYNIKRIFVEDQIHGKNTEHNKTPKAVAFDYEGDHEVVPYVLSTLFENVTYIGPNEVKDAFPHYFPIIDGLSKAEQRLVNKENSAKYGPRYFSDTAKKELMKLSKQDDITDATFIALTGAEKYIDINNNYEFMDNKEIRKIYNDKRKKSNLTNEIWNPETDVMSDKATIGKKGKPRRRITKEREPKRAKK